MYLIEYLLISINQYVNILQYIFDYSGPPSSCPDPGYVTNAERNPSSGPFPPNTALFYTCNQGYTRVGAMRMTCLTNLQWSSPTPNCIHLGEQLT